MSAAGGYNSEMPAQEQVVRVNLAGAPYDIQIGRGVLGNVGAGLAKLTTSRSAALMSDSNVCKHFAARIRATCASAGIKIIAEHEVPAGEENKTLAEIA